MQWLHNAVLLTWEIHSEDWEGQEETFTVHYGQSVRRPGMGGVTQALDDEYPGFESQLYSFLSVLNFGQPIYLLGIFVSLLLNTASNTLLCDCC